MRRLFLLSVLLTLFIDIGVATPGLSQARAIHSGSTELLGVCDEQMLFLGFIGQGTYGILTYDGKRIRRVGSSFKGGRPIFPWGLKKPIPAGLDRVPVVLENSGTFGLATTCGSLGSTKIVIRDFDGVLLEDFIVKDGGLISSRATNTSIEVFSIRGSRATVIGKVRIPTRNRGDKIRGGAVFDTERAILLKAPHPESGQLFLWRLAPGGFTLLSEFSDLKDLGYTKLRVNTTYETGNGKLIFEVAGQSPQDEYSKFYYVTDGSETKRVGQSLLTVMPLKDIDGFLGISGGWQGGCKIGVFRAPNYAMEDITPPGGLVPSDSLWCVNMSPRVTSKSSLFFTHRFAPQRVMRFNIDSGAVTTVCTADAPLGQKFHFSHGRIFFEIDKTKRDLYVSNGTPAGTQPITASGRNLRGVDMEHTVMYKGDMYAWGFTKVNEETGSLLGSALYKVKLPVDEVTE